MLVVGVGGGAAETEGGEVLLIVVGAWAVGMVLVFEAWRELLVSNVLLDSGLEGWVDAELSAGLEVSHVVLDVAVVGIASESVVVGLICAKVAWLRELRVQWHRCFLLPWEFVCHYPWCCFRSKERGILRVLEVIELLKDRHKLDLVHIEAILGK